MRLPQCPPQRTPAPGADDQHIAVLAGHAGQDLAGVAAQHRGLGGDTSGQATEGGIEGVPQALPGVVVPWLAQLRPGMLATAGRQPGQQGDQQGIVLVGELGPLAQRVHAAR